MKKKMNHDGQSVAESVNATVSNVAEFFKSKGVDYIGAYEFPYDHTVSISVWPECNKDETRKKINEILKPYGYKVYGRWGHYFTPFEYVFNTNMPIDKFIEVFGK